MLKGYIRFLLLFLLLIPTLPTQAQSVDDVLSIVLGGLRSSLGREFVLLEYTFEGASWNDASLGCPRPNETYTPENIPGYRWTFLSDDGLRYEVHSNLTGSQWTLCTDLSTPAITYATYTGQFFNIQHPNNWNVQRQSETEYDFVYNFGFACNVPGMQILLTSDYQQALDQLNVKNTNGAFVYNLIDISLPNLNGSTITYQAPCESSQRGWRVSTINSASGTGIVVLQWSPIASFPIWDRVFKEMLGSLQSAATALPENASAPPPATPAQPNVIAEATPETSAPPTVGISAPVETVPQPPSRDITLVPLAHSFVGNIYVGRTNNLPGIPLTFDDTIQRQHLRVAPSTNQLAYVENGSHLNLIPDLTNTNYITPTTNMSPLPPSWSLAGTELAFATTTSAPDELLVQVRRSDGIIDDLGTLTFINDCPSPASNYVVDQLYGTEVESLMFAWLPDGRVLYTPQCDGTGLSIWNPLSGTITNLGDQLHTAHITLDRTKVAVLNAANEILLIDLRTQDSRRLLPSQSPDQLGWDATGTVLYYSARTPQPSFMFDTADPARNPADILGVYPFESRQNTLQIFEVDTRSNIELVRWEGVGFAIGQIEAVPDGSGMIFTLIPTDRQMVNKFAEGQTLRVILNAVPETQLYWLPVGAEAAQLLAITAQPQFGQ